MLVLNPVTNRADEELRTYATKTRSPETASSTSKSVLMIVKSIFLSTAPSLAYAFIAPFVFAYLIDNIHAAGAIMTIATAAALICQMYLSRHALHYLGTHGRLMEMYGESILTAVFSAWGISSMLVTAIVLSSGSADLKGDIRKSVESIMMAYWVVVIVCLLVHLTLAKARQLVNVLYAPNAATASTSMPTLAAALIPEATEPEDAAFAVSIVSAAILVLMCFGNFFLSLLFVTLIDDSQPDSNETVRHIVVLKDLFILFLIR